MSSSLRSICDYILFYTLIETTYSHVPALVLTNTLGRVNTGYKQPGMFVFYLRSDPEVVLC